MPDDTPSRPMGAEHDPTPGLYLHVPFCSAICPYCDFSVLVGDEAWHREYVARILTEMDLWTGAVEERFGGFDTAYLGGGTPSILAEEQLALILAMARTRLNVDGKARWFLEANPEDVTPESVAAWRRLGIGTLSLGVQSFDAEALGFLGRRHGPERSRECVTIAREAGFETVSIDLIYGLPGQSSQAWRRQLEEAVALGPDHLSCYQLTIHQGTPFGFRQARGKLTEMPDDEQAELFFLTHRFLADAGYEGYEVSNFARSPALRSRHNVKYWDHTPYLGLGPSAHSFLDPYRWWNLRKIKPWQERLEAGGRPVEEVEELTPLQLARERLMLALRTRDGLDLEPFRKRYGIDPLATDRPAVERLAAQGLLTLEGSRLAPTLEGLAVADTLAGSFTLGE